MSERKLPQPKREVNDLTSNFYAVVPVSLTSSRNVSHAEFRVLCYLLAHDLPDERNQGRRKGYVTVSRSRIAGKLGIKNTRQVSAALASLQKKGLLYREPVRGKESRIWLRIPDYPPVQTLATKQQGLSDALANEQQGGVATEQQGTLATEQHPKNRSKITSKDVTASSSLMTQQPAPNDKPKRAAKDKAPETLPDIQARLDTIELDSFKKKYPAIDIDPLFRRFSEVCLRGTAQKPGPNPYRYKDFRLAFQQWCRREHPKDRTDLPKAPPTNPDGFKDYSGMTREEILDSLG